MKKYCLLLLLFTQMGYAQNLNMADSLVKDLATQKTDTGKLKTLSELSFYYATNNPALALKYANEQKQIAEKVNIPKFTANAYNDIAIAQYYSGDYGQALQNNKAALAIREKLGSKALLVSSLNKIAIIYQELGKYDTAAVYQFKILKLAEELNDDGFIGITYNNIATIYQNLKQYDKGIEYARMSLIKAETVKDALQMGRSYGTIASNFDHINKYDSALFYYQKSLKIFEGENDLGGISAAYSNIGFIYRRNKRNEDGLAAYKKAYETAIKMGNESDKAFYAADIGNVLLDLKQYKAGYSYLQASMVTAKKDNNLEILKMAYSGLRNYFLLEQNIDSSSFYGTLYQDVVDSLFSTATTKQINELQTQYETEKKEQQINLLNKENTIQKLTIGKSRIFIGITIGLLLAGLAFSYLLYNRYKIKQQAALQQEVMHQQELATEAVIEAEENERKRIARDLHDGVGQMMSAARMNLSLLEDHIHLSATEKMAYEKAVALVDESCKEVRSVSHNMMPNALIKTGLASAVRAFIEQIETPSLKVQLYTEGLNESINKNTETVLYRVLQECVNNVIKHAGATNLDIALIKDETGINATIEDNGKGFDTSDKNKYTGMGLDNMQKRIDFLKGTIEWQSSLGAGTLVAVYVPSAV